MNSTLKEESAPNTGNFSQVIALLTDFGTKDEFVGVMKGVIACIAPNVQVVDITHEITPYAIVEAAFKLRVSYPFFPQGCVFLAVVDPGVGTKRRAIAIETSQYRFVAPDNGLLWFLVEQDAVLECRQLTNPRYHLKDIPSSTFHGRDIFAPVAAHLANGTDISALGEKLDPSMLEKPEPAQTRSTEDEINLAVVSIDRFGNIVTAIDYAQFIVWAAQSRMFLVQASGVKTFPANLVTTYADSGAAKVCLIKNSSGLLELAVNLGNAADVLRLNAIKPGNTQITIRRQRQ